MSLSNSLKPDSTPGPLWVVRVFAVAALAGSAYLAWQSHVAGAVAGCGEAGDCEQVLSSQWSHWLGVPVGAAVVIVYAAVLGATLGMGLLPSAVVRRRCWAALEALCVVSVG